VFVELAKLRALRLLVADVLDACGVDAPSVHLVARSSPRVLTRRDPWINMIRNTVCNLIGAIGGAETIISVPFDAALDGPPSALGRRIARNTHTILAEEAHLEAVLDPAGGSWWTNWQRPCAFPPTPCGAISTR